MLVNLANDSTKKRGSRERSSPPCQVNTLILSRCPEARGNIDLDLTLTQKFCRTLGPRGATLTDHVCAPSNGIQAAVYDSIGPATGAHERQKRCPLGSPNLKPSAQVGAGCRPKAQTAPYSRDPLVGNCKRIPSINVPHLTCGFCGLRPCAMSAIGPSRRLATALHMYAFGSKAVQRVKEQTLIGLSLCEFRLARLRLEKSFVNTERTGVPMIKNKWDFG